MRSAITNLFDIFEDVLHDALIRLFVDCVLTDRQVAYDLKGNSQSENSPLSGLPYIWEIVIDSVLFGRQLFEEQLGEIGYSGLFVF